MNPTRNIPVKFVYPKDEKHRVEFANQFAIMQVDMDVILDVCVVDLKQVLDINQKLQTGTAQPDDILEANVIHRIGMSISSLVKLKQQLDQIFQNLEKQGVLVKKMDGGLAPGSIQ